MCISQSGEFRRKGGPWDRRRCSGVDDYEVVLGIEFMIGQEAVLVPSSGKLFIHARMREPTIVPIVGATTKECRMTSIHVEEGY